MNKIVKVLAAAFAVGCPMMVHGADMADTVRIIDDPSSVIITTSGGHTSVRVVEKDSPGRVIRAGEQDVSMPFVSRKTRVLSGKRSKVLFLNGLFGGVVIPVDKPAGMLVSWEIGVADLLGYSVRTSARGPWLSAGIGLAYRWFNVGDGYGLVREEDRMVLRPLPETGNGMCDPKSRFTTSSFLLTFSMKQYLYKRWAFMLSAVLDFNFYTDGFFQYSTDASRPVRTRIHYKDFRQRVMRCDVMATVGLSGIAGAYVRYSPSALFKGDHGPGFEQIAAGVSFFF